MGFQQPGIVDEILRKPFGHMHRGHVPEPLVAIL